MIISRDRLDLSWDEKVFGLPEKQQDIIEEYDEEKEKVWRERHRIRMREQKKREADERESLLKEDGDKDYMAILEEAELMEELENDLEQLNVDSDETLRTHLQTDQPKNSEHLTFAGSFNEQDDSSDEIASKEFMALSKQVANRSDAEKIKVYEERLSKITDYLDENKKSNMNTFNELIEKQMEKGNLEEAIEELREGMIDMSIESSIEKSKQVQPRAKQSPVPIIEKRTYNKREDYEKYEKECRDQNKSTSEILIFYKSQLRNLMKTLTKCTIDLTNNDDKTDLYEYICDRIDELRFEIHKEKQTKAEEDFVDDEDIEREKKQSESEPDFGMDSNDDSTSGRRKISFASEPIVTTFHEDDEPWRVQMENNVEHLNNLMDSTFQFFNSSPSSSSASSICGDDEEQCAVATRNGNASQNPNENDPNTKSVDTSINASNKNCTETSESSRSATLILRFNHSTNECTTVTGDSDHDSTIRSPLDIYKQFGGIDSDATTQKLSTESAQKSDTDALKGYVMNVANLDTDTICQQMRDNYEKRNAMKITMENEKLNESNASSDIPNIDVKPNKSILKNRNAVSLETHQSSLIEDDDEEDGMSLISILIFLSFWKLISNFFYIQSVSNRFTHKMSQIRVHSVISLRYFE